MELFRKTIQSVTIDCGNTIVTLPFADLKKSDGPTLLVTAGVDGDEYAGIEAAYEAIKIYAKAPFVGRLIIFPIINVHGFLNETSKNPVDNKFPKLVGLGNPNGTESERIMHWIVEHYASKASIWLDLHGAALTEEVFPFIWTYKTGVKNIDHQTQSIVQSLSTPLAVAEPTGRNSKATKLAAMGCSYIVTEAGNGHDPQAITQHLSWLAQTMSVLGMVKKQLKQPQPTIHAKIHYYLAPFDGIWHITHQQEKAFKGTILGTVSNQDEMFSKPIIANQTGRVLWYKTGLSMKKGDVLFAVSR